MSPELLHHVLRRSLVVLVRHPLASLLSVLLSALYLYGLGWIGLMVLRIPQVIPGWLTSADAIIYLGTEVPSTDEQRILAELKSWPEIGSARLVSKGDAHARLEKQLGRWKGVLSGMGQNTLPSSIEVTLDGKFRTPELREKTIERIRLMPDVAEILYGKGDGDKIELFLGWIRIIGWTLTGLFILGSIGIHWSVTLNMLLGAQDEIQILDWVGAPGWLIRLPFFLLAWMVGVLGTTIALALFAATVHYLAGGLPLPLAALLSVERSEWMLLGSVLTMGSALTGCVGVWFALSRMNRDCSGHDSY